MKFSIVTPAYNMEPWISRTIETVLMQEGDFDIEYIIINDGSKDNSAGIAQKYADKVASGEYPIKARSVTMQVITQENTGMYEAINRGFARATGDIFAWINADDTYQPGAFAAMAKVFETFPDIVWLKGMTDTVGEQWEKQRTGQCRIYRQDWLQLGIYGREAYFVEQDSTFWKRELWQKVQPMPKQYRSAADYWLWIQMAKHAPLWSLKFPVSNFMKRAGQISKGVSKYNKEQLDTRPHRPLRGWFARLIFSPYSRFYPTGEKFFIWLYSKLFMHGTEEYIEIDNGVAVKKKASSFVC
jgi:glycosyltransferase involved in cell wall biosynthesis